VIEDRVCKLEYKDMTKFIRDFVRNESGAAAAEYALILSIVGAGIAGAAFYLGGEINSGITGAGDMICSASGSTC
jgi:pilus assembly protein Flp/PilA